MNEFVAEKALQKYYIFLTPQTILKYSTIFLD